MGGIILYHSTGPKGHSPQEGAELALKPVLLHPEYTSPEAFVFGLHFPLPLRATFSPVHPFASLLQPLPPEIMSSFSTGIIAAKRYCVSVHNIFRVYAESFSNIISHTSSYR